MSSAESKHFDAVIVGAGFAGMYLVHRLRNMGFSVRCIESAGDVGGTWYWNRYPGARCDVPSLQYSFKFDEQLQQDWQWPERYSAQPEILEYAKHVADRFDLRKDITFNTKVESAHYNEDAKHWDITTSDNESLTAQFCIMASGALSSTNYPEIKGIKSFKGELYHTGAWPQDKTVDFSGKRVGIIGTGSSGIQAIPVLAEQAEHLHVFQRTPQYAIPARNKPMDKEEEAEVKANYKAYRDKIYRMPGAVLRDDTVKSLAEASGPEEIEEVLEKAWQTGGTNYLRAFSDLMENTEKNEIASEFAKKKMRKIVKDPDILEMLTPDYPVGCKRIVLDTNYFETYNRDDVTLVSCANKPIEEITEKGLVVDGTEYELDCIIFATGYDAMTGALTRIDIRGSNETVKETWKDGPKAFLGLAVNGFPNMFTICGPGSPSVLANVITHIEQNVEWISDCIAYMRDHDKKSIEVTREAELEWSAHVAELGDASLFAKCNSWYVGANIPGKPRVFLAYTGGFPGYTDKCDDIAARGYSEFNLTG